MKRAIPVFRGCVIVALAAAAPALAYENPYTYVRMSLFVPWLLYFVFLAAVLIPFVLLIALAWRSYLAKRRGPDVRH